MLFRLREIQPLAWGHNNGVAFFSLEMTAIQLVVRLLSVEAKVNQQKIRTGHTLQDDNKKIVNSLGKLADAPIFIDDTPGLSLMELRAKARRLKSRAKYR